MYYNTIHKDRIRYGILTNLKDSFSPFRTGLRRKDLLHRLIVENEHIFGKMPPEEYAAFNMRFQRILNSLVKDGTLIRDSKDHKKTFYRLDKEAYIEFLNERGEIIDQEKFSQSLARDIIQKSKFLRLPPIPLLIGETDYWMEIGEWNYSEYKQRIIDKVIEYIEPQIQDTWNAIKSERNLLIEDDLS